MSGRRPRSGRAPSGSVRIIGGQWRGTKLPVADAEGLRPTSDRVRETLFNWLQNKLPGARVLDLFAGSGALGLEAVSRGAKQALLVERDPRLAESLRAAVERLQARDQAEVVRADAQAWLQAPVHGRFDVVFVDPPFADGQWKEVLTRLGPWLADEAWLYLEMPLAAAVDPGEGWHLHRSGETREVRYALFRRLPRPDGAAATLPGGPSSDPA